MGFGDNALYKSTFYLLTYLHTKTVAHPGTNRAQRRATSPIETSVLQLRLCGGLQQRFDFDSTAVRLPFDCSTIRQRYDHSALRSTRSGLLHRGPNSVTAVSGLRHWHLDDL